MNTENNRFINFMMTDYRNIFLPSFFILFSICLFGQNSVVQTFDTDISKNKIKLYTTAKDTDLRLTRGDDHFFSNLVQPLETEIAIFVNPKKTFQKFFFSNTRGMICYYKTKNKNFTLGQLFLSFYNYDQEVTP